MLNRDKFPRAPIRRPLDVPAPITYAVAHETTSPKFAKAFAQGCGGRIAGIPTPPMLQPGGFAAFCTPPTWPLLDMVQREHRTYYYGDHAYWGRGRYYRVARNAVQYVPSAFALARATPQRLVHEIGISPSLEWNRSGLSVVICPNSAEYMHRYGIDSKAWTLDMVRQVATVSNRPIVVRHKAMVGRRPLYLDLHDAWAVVVFSSNAAVESLVHGVPIFVTAPWASTAALAKSDLSQIESPYYPTIVDRNRFLWSLAEHQWTLTELANGTAWKALHVD